MADTFGPPVSVIPLKCGRGSQCDVLREDTGDTSIVVKDYSRQRGWRRLLARWIIAREDRAYRILNGFEGAPEYLGRSGPVRIRLAYVKGKLCDEYEVGQLPDDFFDQLAHVVGEMHLRGIAHNDLKRKRNILVTPDFHPLLIDFAAAWWRKPEWNPLRQWLFHQLCEIDRNAIAKLKRRLAPHLLNEEDQRRLDRPTILERIARRLLNR